MRRRKEESRTDVAGGIPWRANALKQAPNARTLTPTSTPTPASSPSSRALFSPPSMAWRRRAHDSRRSEGGGGGNSAAMMRTTFQWQRETFQAIPIDPMAYRRAPGVPRRTSWRRWDVHARLMMSGPDSDPVTAISDTSSAGNDSNIGGYPSSQGKTKIKVVKSGH